MISSKLFLFIERVVAAEMGIVVHRGVVCLGAKPRATAGNDPSAQLTDGIKAEIIDVFVEGEFDRWELATFLTKEPPASVAHLWPELVRTRSSP